MKVGHLLPVTIVKALPGHESYLTQIAGAGMLALFPRKFAGREYKVGDSTLAAVYWISGSRVLLSQKSPHFIRRIVELVLTDLISGQKVIIKKAAMLTGARFAKVAIESQNGFDALKECLPCPKETKAYTDDTIILVRYSPNPKEYVANALAPAPAANIKAVRYYRDKKAEVIVEKDRVGSFLGKGGMNAATAAKLTGIQITIIPSGK